MDELKNKGLSLTHTHTHILQCFRSKRNRARVTRTRRARDCVSCVSKFVALCSHNFPIVWFLITISRSENAFRQCVNEKIRHSDQFIDFWISIWIRKNLFKLYKGLRMDFNNRFDWSVLLSRKRFYCWNQDLIPKTNISIFYTKNCILISAASCAMMMKNNVNTLFYINEMYVQKSNWRCVGASMDQSKNGNPHPYGIPTLNAYIYI